MGSEFKAEINYVIDRLECITDIIDNWDEIRKLREIVKSHFTSFKFPELTIEDILKITDVTEAKLGCIESLNQIPAVVEIKIAKPSEPELVERYENCLTAIYNGGYLALMKALSNGEKTYFVRDYATVMQSLSLDIIRAQTRGKITEECHLANCTLSKFVTGSCTHIYDTKLKNGPMMVYISAKKSLLRQVISFGVKVGFLHVGNTEVVSNINRYGYDEGDQERTTLLINRNIRAVVVSRITLVWLQCARKLGLPKDVRCLIRDYVAAIV